MKQFAEKHALWMGAVEAMAQLDALLSLACAAAFGADGEPMCRPTFLGAYLAVGVGCPELVETMWWLAVASTSVLGC